MKTKVLLLLAVLAMIVYSCTTDREEEVQNPVELETLKTNNRDEASKVNDSIDFPDHQLADPPSTGLEPDPNPADPNDPEIIPPGDIKPPKGGK